MWKLFEYRKVFVALLFPDLPSLEMSSVLIRGQRVNMLNLEQWRLCQNNELLPISVIKFQFHSLWPLNDLCISVLSLILTGSVKHDMLHAFNRMWLVHVCPLESALTVRMPDFHICGAEKRWVELMLFSQTSFCGRFALLRFFSGLTEAASAAPPISRLCYSCRSSWDCRS